MKTKISHDAARRLKSTKSVAQGVGTESGANPKRESASAAAAAATRSARTRVPRL